MYAARKLRLPGRGVLSALTKRGKVSLSDGDLSDERRKPDTLRHLVKHDAAMEKRTLPALPSLASLKLKLQTGNEHTQFLIPPHNTQQPTNLNILRIRRLLRRQQPGLHPINPIPSTIAIAIWFRNSLRPPILVGSSTRHRRHSQGTRDAIVADIKCVCE